jgi:Phage integrase, N-terminal SAM-like domain
VSVLQAEFSLTPVLDESVTGRIFIEHLISDNLAIGRPARVRSNTYIDPRAGRTTLTEWVNQWYPALDLEPSTLSNYKYRLEVLILPSFGDQPLASITAEQVSTWERKLVTSGYSQRTAKDARSTLITALGDAVPRYISANPAVRRRGKGRKGQRRIQRIEHAEKRRPGRPRCRPC